MPVLGRTKKDVLLEFRTSEILHAARAVFAHQGFNRATMDDIADEAGVAKGTVYLYFPSKRDLFMATLREGVVGLHERVRREIDAAQSTADRVRAFMGARLRYCADNRDFFRIYYTEFASLQVRSANAQPEFQDLYDEQAALLARVLERGLLAGELRGPLDTTKTAHLIYEITRAAIAKHVLQWPGEPIESTIDLLFDFTWRGIGCR
jgi:TetR/AcrR family fatty acid metabolism transcriptional regulator